MDLCFTVRRILVVLMNAIISFCSSTAVLPLQVLLIGVTFGSRGYRSYAIKKKFKTKAKEIRVLGRFNNMYEGFCERGWQEALVCSKTYPRKHAQTSSEKLSKIKSAWKDVHFEFLIRDVFDLRGS